MSCYISACDCLELERGWTCNLECRGGDTQASGHFAKHAAGASGLQILQAVAVNETLAFLRVS